MTSRLPVRFQFLKHDRTHTPHGDAEVHAMRGANMEGQVGPVVTGQALFAALR